VEGCCDNHAKPRSHDTSRIACAKLMARVGEEFPLECPACGGNIRLIAFITDPGPIRKILTHLGEPLEPPPVSPARGPPTDWGELVQVHDDRAVFQASPDDLPARRAVSRPVCADKKTPALSVDRKHLGTPTIGRGGWSESLHPLGRIAPPTGANRSTPGPFLPVSCAPCPFRHFWRIGTGLAHVSRHEPSREVGRHEPQGPRGRPFAGGYSVPVCAVFRLLSNS
jgi:hypothetical protein